MVATTHHTSSTIIGVVESVSPDEILVRLNSEAPQAMSLHLGNVMPFPQVNGYVLIPSQSGAIVGHVEWLGISKALYSAKKGYKDDTLVELPIGARYLKLTPVGTLIGKNGENSIWQLERGVLYFPAIGDGVTLPTREQVKAIVAGSQSSAKVAIGTCPYGFNEKLRVDPNIMFGRHLAVLGNTGSGKSCTVASVIQSMIRQAKNVKDVPNARFIVLDPNGEYSECFKDICPDVRVFRPNPVDENVKAFKLPAWMWNSEEWSAITQAAYGVQRPTLQKSLRELRLGKDVSVDFEHKKIIRCRSFLHWLSRFDSQGVVEYRDIMNLVRGVELIIEDLNTYKSYLSENDTIDECINKMHHIKTNRCYDEKKKGYNPFSDTDIIKIRKAVESLVGDDKEEIQVSSITEDSPVKFNIKFMPDSLKNISRRSGEKSHQYVETLIMRVEALLNDSRILPIIDDNNMSLEYWLGDVIGENEANNGQIAVIDLSLMPYEILHLTIAVAARIIFESQQRYMRQNKKSLPTTLVLEEAHTFVSKDLAGFDDKITPKQMCRQIFEKIAREGRKYGLGLVVSSQRASEVSESVLSQCNTYLVHRITSYRDQEIISKLVPDNSRGLLKELPSLPTRHCVMMGAAVEIPVLVEIPILERKDKPMSEDPKFWEVWVGLEEREIDWRDLVKEWVGKQLR